MFTVRYELNFYLQFHWSSGCQLSRYPQISDTWSCLIVIPWLKETSAFHRRRNKRLYPFGPILNHLYKSSLLSVFPNIRVFLSSMPDLSGEFYGGELIKIFIGIAIFFLSGNCRVDLTLGLGQVFLRVLRLLLSVSFHYSIYPSSC
jgi:hypothetical protein